MLKMIEECAEKAAKSIADEWRCINKITTDDSAHRSEVFEQIVGGVENSDRQTIVEAFQPLSDAVAKLVEAASIGPANPNQTLPAYGVVEVNISELRRLWTAANALKGTDHAER